MSRNELPPLSSPPPPIGHNGGPLLDMPNAGPSRRPGRPTVSTPQLRDRIFELLRDGVPLRVMCRAGVAARGGRAAAGKAGGASRSAPVRGRENGLSRSYDGRLDVKLAVAGSARIGANPEQLFATAWSACFVGAIRACGAQEENRPAGRPGKTPKWISPWEWRFVPSCTAQRQPAECPTRCRPKSGRRRRLANPKTRERSETRRPDQPGRLGAPCGCRVEAGHRFGHRRHVGW
jgi:hypothetical protein